MLNKFKKIKDVKNVKFGNRVIKIQDIYENPSFRNPNSRLNGKVVWHIAGWENSKYVRIDLSKDEVILI